MEPMFWLEKAVKSGCHCGQRRRGLFTWCIPFDLSRSELPTSQSREANKSFRSRHTVSPHRLELAKNANVQTLTWIKEKVGIKNERAALVKETVAVSVIIRQQKKTYLIIKESP